MRDGASMHASPGAPSSGRLRLLAVAGVIILLAVWAAASLAAGSFFVPAPWVTAVDTAQLLLRPGTWTQILITLLRVGVGFLVGLAAGAAVGMAVGARREAEALLRPLVSFFQGMPPLLWAIPLVALMGIGHLPTIIVITLITFPLVAITIGEGMATLPRDLGDMLAVFAPGFRARLRELVVPHLAPFFGAAVNAGLVLAVKASVTAEYFGANDGIGFQIQSAYMSLRVRSLFSWAAVLILLILAFTWLLPRARRSVPGLIRRLRDRRPLEGGYRPLEGGQGDLGELQRRFSMRSAATEVRLDSVSFSYVPGNPVLEGVSLRVAAGEVVVLSGDSGVGKTTLLKVAASLVRPSAGTVIVPERVGCVFQDDRLLPWRSVAENAALPLRYLGSSRREAMGVAQWLLREAGLEVATDQRPETLSGGMKKRAALARCFARLPDLVLMDEPFSGLHAPARAHLWRMFLRLHALHPVPAVVVTHYPEEISAATPCRRYRLVGQPAHLSAEDGPPRRRRNTLQRPDRPASR